MCFGCLCYARGDRIDMKRGRKIPFENVVRNIGRKRYTRIVQADYSNLGAELFEEMKFADNLGVDRDWLREIGLVKITNQAGWNLPTCPTQKELLSFKKVILKRRR